MEQTEIWCRWTGSKVQCRRKGEDTIMTAINVKFYPIRLSLREAIVLKYPSHLLSQFKALKETVMERRLQTKAKLLKHSQFYRKDV